MVVARRLSLRRLAGALLLGGCMQAALALPASATEPGAGTEPPARPGAMAEIIGRSLRLLVVLPAPGDRFDALAERFLGDPALAWQLGPPGGSPEPGEPLVLPLVNPNPAGISPQGMQSVPVLSYHRLTERGAGLAVAGTQFQAQLQTLLAEGWRFQRGAALAAFLRGEQGLPERSLLLSLDGSDASLYERAFPVLQALQLPAMLFLSVESVGQPGQLSWEQVRQMTASGLVTLQSGGLNRLSPLEQMPGEDARALRRRLEAQVQLSRRRIEQLEGQQPPVQAFAPPFGRIGEALLQTLQRNDFALGFSALPGSNPAVAPPLLLRRIVVPGHWNEQELLRRLQHLTPLTLAAPLTP